MLRVGQRVRVNASRDDLVSFMGKSGTVVETGVEPNIYGHSGILVKWDDGWDNKFQESMLEPIEERKEEW